MKKTLAYALLCVLSTSAVAATEGFSFGLTAGYDASEKTTAEKINHMTSAELATGYSFSNGLSLDLSAKGVYSITSNTFKTVAPTLAAAMQFAVTEKFSLTPTIGVSAKFAVENFKATVETAEKALDAANKLPADTKDKEATVLAATADLTAAKEALTADESKKFTDRISIPFGLKAGYDVNENFNVSVAVNNDIKTLATEPAGKESRFTKGSELAVKGTYSLNDADAALSSIAASVSMLGSKDSVMGGFGGSLSFNF